MKLLLTVYYNNSINLERNVFSVVRNLKQLGIAEIKSPLPNLFLFDYNGDMEMLKNLIFMLPNDGLFPYLRQVQDEEPISYPEYVTWTNKDTYQNDLSFEMILKKLN